MAPVEGLFCVLLRVAGGSRTGRAVGEKEPRGPLQTGKRSLGARAGEVPAGSGAEQGVCPVGRIPLNLRNVWPNETAQQVMAWVEALPAGERVIERALTVWERRMTQGASRAWWWMKALGEREEPETYEDARERLEALWPDVEGDGDKERSWREAMAGLDVAILAKAAREILLAAYLAPGWMAEIWTAAHELAWRSPGALESVRRSLEEQVKAAR